MSIRQILSVLLRKTKRLPWLVKTLGVKGTLHYAYNTYGIKGLLRPLFKNPPPALQIDLLDFYSFVDYAYGDVASGGSSRREAAAPEAGSVALGDAPIKPNTFNWVIPDFQVGSGGHRTIFRMVEYLEQQGYENRLIIAGPTQFSEGAAARRVIREHFMPLAAEVTLGEASLKPAEFTVATGWQTAYPVRRFAATRHKVYFIQDFEPYFFPHGSEYAFAEATYRFGFTAITAGNWLAETVSQQYGMKAYPFSFSYDKEVHCSHERRDNIRRLFFYARHVTPRRGFELGLLALARVHAIYPDLHVILAGWDCSAYRLPFTHLNAGIVSPKVLADLYSQCDAGLVLSHTNVSLLPLELMACGCPVVSNDGRNVDWLLEHGKTALLAEPTPQALADALLQILGQPELARRLRENGLAHARSTDWQREARRVHDYFMAIRESDAGAADQLHRPKVVGVRSGSSAAST